MLIVLSPAKSLDFESPVPRISRTQRARYAEPRMLDATEHLVGVMGTMSPADLVDLMGISESLAELNVERYDRLSAALVPDTARPAVFAFAGDVYQGMQAWTFDARDLTHAQKAVRILSGLYGLLRPLDLIAPHRLEMGTRLATDRGATLYDFWGDRITDQVAADLHASPGTPALVNLASQEYARAVRADRLGARVVTPRFLDAGADGEPRVVGFLAKRARGAMAGWMVRNRVTTLAGLDGFAELGYRLDTERSTRDAPVFVRAQ